ncbi:MAG TPA: hypothetical protein VLV78_07570 [Thermoanaerobaculia bacterium]|nr:hypothetical protein [Thermoanaerobaculia bacterium]
MRSDSRIAAGRFVVVRADRVRLLFRLAIPMSGAAAVLGRRSALFPILAVISIAINVAATAVGELQRR